MGRGSHEPEESHFQADKTLKSFSQETIYHDAEGFPNRQESHFQAVIMPKNLSPEAMYPSAKGLTTR
jgi:hypothetical protein